jgi:hypothetical protein
MAKAIVSKGVFQMFCTTCRSKFTYEFTDTFLKTTSDYTGSKDIDRVVKCPVCENDINHTRGVGNTA